MDRRQMLFGIPAFVGGFFVRRRDPKIEENCSEDGIDILDLIDSRMRELDRAILAIAKSKCRHVPYCGGRLEGLVLARSILLGKKEDEDWISYGVETEAIVQASSRTQRLPSSP